MMEADVILHAKKKNMADLQMATSLTILFLLPSVVFTASEEALTIVYPSVIAHAKDNGNFTMMSGYNGDILIAAGPNNTGEIYFDGESLSDIFQMILSEPPVWDDHSPFGYLGEFHSGHKIDIRLRAKDPEGGHITYSLIAGQLPPGISLDGSTGEVKGLVPDADTTYTFTIRATDPQGKYADNVFKLVARGDDFCSTNPCNHEGVCQDLSGDFRCSCVNPYGGKRCELDCRNHALGVDYRYKRIPDGSMSGYNTYSTYYAYNGRINGGAGWYGYNTTSWLQIDLGNNTEVYGIQMQGCGTYYFTRYYNLEYSLDGNNFMKYSTGTTPYDSLTGTTSTSLRTTHLTQTFVARYVRIIPTSFYSTSYHPCMKVEILGCHTMYL